MDSSDEDVISACMMVAVDCSVAATAVAVTATTASALLFGTDDEASNKREKRDHQKEKRSIHHHFCHKEALLAIQRDYISVPGGLVDPLFGSEISMMFQLSRTRFQHLMEDVQAKGIQFYLHRKEVNGRYTASMEARLLLPMQTLVYGVSSHVFCDYFQMSPEFARECRKQFDDAIQMLYYAKFLRRPSLEDLKGICCLHKAIHNVEGMFGSLDCTPTYWKNCPKAWQGSFKGKEDKPSIVLEGLCDHHMFFGMYPMGMQAL